MCHTYSETSRSPLSSCHLEILYMLWKSHTNCVFRKNTNFSHIINILVQFSIVNEVICRFGDFWSNFLYDFILYASNTHEFMKTVPLLTLKYHFWFGPPSGLNLDLNLTPPRILCLRYSCGDLCSYCLAGVSDFAWQKWGLCLVHEPTMFLEACISFLADQFR